MAVDDASIAHDGQSANGNVRSSKPHLLLSARAHLLGARARDGCKSCVCVLRDASVITDYRLSNMADVETITPPCTSCTELNAND